jgi:hypothetical protein
MFATLPWELTCDVICHLQWTEFLAARSVCHLFLRCCNSDRAWSGWEPLLDQCPAINKKCQHWPMYKRLFFEKRLMHRYDLLMGIPDEEQVTQLGDLLRMHAYHLLMSDQSMVLVEDSFPIKVVEQCDNRHEFFRHLFFEGKWINYRDGVFTSDDGVLLADFSAILGLEQKFESVREFLDQAQYQGYTLRIQECRLEQHKGDRYIPVVLPCDQKTKRTAKLFKFGVFKIKGTSELWSSYKKSKLHGYRKGVDETEKESRASSVYLKNVETPSDAGPENYW